MIRLTAVVEAEGQAPRALTHESNARQIIIGRDPTADFRLPLSSASRHHARIIETDDVYVIEDLGSTHGTLLNGKKLAQGDRKMLKNGDIIEITRARITCAIDSAKITSATPGEATVAIAQRAVEGILGRIGDTNESQPYFRVLAGPDVGAQLPLSGTRGEWTLGRTQECELLLNDPNVSRRHAHVKKDWHGYWISDLGSKNGVLVNEHKIEKPRRLKDRDEVIIGPVKLMFVDPNAELFEALRDVPGFELPEGTGPQDLPAEASHLGAPENSGAAPAPTPDMEQEAPSEFADVDADAIDPALLAQTPAKSRVEWIVFLVAALVLIGCAVGLYLILR